MKRLIAIAMILIGAGAWICTAQERSVEDSTAAFMRVKLAHAQDILEGLTTDDFEEVERAAHKIAILSLDEAWRVIQTEEYLAQSLEFQRTAEQLAKDAKSEDLDAATLAYLDMTAKCIKCHKMVRGVRTASQ
jgi:hypothetical protein